MLLKPKKDSFENIEIKEPKNKLSRSKSMTNVLEGDKEENDQVIENNTDIDIFEQNKENEEAIKVYCR